MAKYLVCNQSNYALQVTIPSSNKDRNSAQITIPPGGALDILPWAGSIDACKRIAFIRDLCYRGLARVEEE